MNTTKYSRAIASLALSLALGGVLQISSGCSPKQDDVWEQTPSERQEAVLQKLKSDLVASEEGWILELIPDKSLSYGGYQIGLKFDAKGQVIATSEALENADKTSDKILLTAQRSEYTLAKDDRLVLSFDVNNDAIHYYSRPDTDLGAGRGKGKGFLGDFRFKVMSSSLDTIHLEGQKTGNRMVMYRASKDIEAYMTDIVTQKRKLFNLTSMRSARQDALEYRLTEGGEVAEVLNVSEQGYNHYSGTNTEGKKTAHPFFVTPTGIRMFSKDGVAKDFTWDATNSKLVAADGANIVARPDPTYPKYAAYLGGYSLTMEGFEDTPVPVTLEETGYQTYVLRGFGFDINARYNPRTNRVEIPLPQTNIPGLPSNVRLIAWTLDGYVNWATGVVLYSSYISGSNPKKYKFIGNKRINKDPQKDAAGFYLWTFDENGKSTGAYRDANYPLTMARSITLTKN